MLENDLPNEIINFINNIFLFSLIYDYDRRLLSKIRELIRDFLLDICEYDQNKKSSSFSIYLFIQSYCKKYTIKQIKNIIFNIEENSNKKILISFKKHGLYHPKTIILILNRANITEKLYKRKKYSNEKRIEFIPLFSLELKEQIENL